MSLTRRAGLTGAMALSFARMAAAATSPPKELAELTGDGATGRMLSVGVIARRGDGTIALNYAGGLRLSSGSHGDVARPYSLDDPFRVASISKLVTTTGLMSLIANRQASLDDDASAFLGFTLRHPAWPDDKITVQHLLSHTSGLRNGPSYPVPAGRRLAEAFVAGGRNYDRGAWFGPAEHAPGDWFSYADVNFALIGQIIERLTDERFDRFMTRTVLKPLGLDAGYNWSGVSQGKRDRAASGRRWKDKAWAPQVDASPPRAPAVDYPQPPAEPAVIEKDLKLGENGFHFSPLGGLRLSVRDLDRLATVYAHGGELNHVRIIGAGEFAQMTEAVWRFDPDRPNGDTESGFFGGYGLGVECPQGLPGPAGDAFFGADSADWRGHFGDAYGWMTGLFWNQQTGASISYALNGMPERGRPAAQRSALTGPEEVIIDAALSALKHP